MKRLSEISKILEKEPEEWLAYLHGQQIKNLSHLINYKSKFTGVFSRSLVFFYQILRLFFYSCMRKKEKTKKVGYYFYFGSVNQANSLTSTVNSFKKRKVEVRVDVNDSHKFKATDDINRINQLNINVSDLVVSTVLFFVHGKKLIFRLKKNDLPEAIKYLNTFCLSYFYLAVFYRLLNVYKPSYVIVANDHNVDCRCLLAVARYLSIKTVYMQHASVSELFPALTVDYAFLDGEHALNIYRNCMSNLPNSCVNSCGTKVFLSGQKKVLSSTKKKANNKIGLAINKLDEMLDIIELIDKLVSENKSISLRWHPGQYTSDILYLKKFYSNNFLVNLSDPKKQTINDYLGELDYLIAGNSSIHLEAAIADVTTIYYEFRPQGIEDYYGFVRNGIAIQAETYESLLAILSARKKPKKDVKSIQYFSATYGTQWYGKEGELVADILLSLHSGKNWKNLFEARKYFQ